MVEHTGGVVTGGGWVVPGEGGYGWGYLRVVGWI